MKTEVTTYRTHRLLTADGMPSRTARRNNASSPYRFLPLCFLALAPLFSSCTDYYDETPTQEELARMNRGSMAQVAFSVGSAYTTRMTDEAVQTDYTFRGIESLHLIPFSVSAPTATPVTKDLNRRGNELIEFRSIAQNQLNNHPDNPDNFNTYKEKVSVPYGTNAFLCYGKAPSRDPKLEGAITENNILALTPAGISFSLQPIVSDPNTITAAGSKGQLLVDFLNGLYAAGNWTDDVILRSFKDDIFTANNTAGSSANVLAMTMKLYNALKFAENNTAVNPVTEYIKTKVDVTNGTWRSDSNLDGYPGNLNLPDGAAYISWNTTDNKYEVVTTKNNMGALDIYPIQNVVYPPTIYYYANSRILTHDKVFPDDQLAIIFNTGRTKWGNEDNWNGGHAGTTPQSNIVLDQPDTDDNSEFFFAGNMVNAGTTVVGIAKSLQYAVARLDVKMKVDDGNTTGDVKLKDFKGNEITVTAGTFPLKGILIAGQKDVDWKFETSATATDSKTFTIYDSQIETSATEPSMPADRTSESAATHTLAFETYPNEPVIVALEFLNNSGVDFVTGADKRIVPNGCRFYLIGKLDPTAENGVNANGNTHGKVLCQDQVTTVTLTVKSLAEAYNVIPDLSQTALEFSLGVIDWKFSTPASAPLE